MAERTYGRAVAKPVERVSMCRTYALRYSTAHKDTSLIEVSRSELLDEKEAPVASDGREQAALESPISEHSRVRNVPESISWTVSYVPSQFYRGKVGRAILQRKNSLRCASEFLSHRNLTQLFHRHFSTNLFTGERWMRSNLCIPGSFLYRKRKRTMKTHRRADWKFRLLFPRIAHESSFIETGTYVYIERPSPSDTRITHRSGQRHCDDSRELEKKVAV